jgi:hypothetical protein
VAQGVDPELKLLVPQKKKQKGHARGREGEVGPSVPTLIMEKGLHCLEKAFVASLWLGWGYGADRYLKYRVEERLGTQEACTSIWKLGCSPWRWASYLGPSWALRCSRQSEDTVLMRECQSHSQ